MLKGDINITDKTKSQTYNFLSENKSIEDIKKQPTTTAKVKRRHGGKTFKLIQNNNTNKSINDDLSENEIFYDDLDNIDTEKISTSQILTKEIGTQTETIEEKSNINLKKYSYNAITFYDEKQIKNTAINKMYEEILLINNEIYFITTFVHIDNSITEKVLYFDYYENNDDLQIINQIKKYQNVNEYKNDFSLI
ncbi:hypothetical protein [Spiroplasma endosymbiont of Apeira syringaria]|uniref:hypothetical protein n=1 Tax=Spiroplasma endosymbiont of Apeira syringaria TaxID=3066307 RepID=UPI0030CD29E4